MPPVIQGQPLRSQIGTLNQDHTFSLRDKRFLIHFNDQATPYSHSSNPVLVTVFTVPRERPIMITSIWLQSNIENYQREDDVFDTAFLQGIILFGLEEKDVEITADAHDYLKAIGTEWINCLVPGFQRFPIPELAPGPYVLVGGHLEEVWRLHGDTNGAFLTAVQPGQTDPFVYLQSPVAQDGFLDVAVPSRLKFRSSTLPLAGLRVAVKDNFLLKGIKTSLCNRAYYEIYPPPSATALCIQQLIDLGAIVLGKTKLNSFGTWEEPTEYVDYQAPWNPRADGYQSPGGSSSGSGAAVGAYDWVDVAIGSDTGGSISRPGLWNGCFALRPSFGAVPVEGLVASIRLFDMPGFLGRDLRKFRDFAIIWYANKLQKVNLKRFSRIIWPTDYWGTISPEQCAMAQKFVQDMEISLNLKHEKISFKEEWDRSQPQNMGTVPLDEYMRDAMTHVWYDDYHAHDHFREAYWRKYNKAPYISPAVRENWNICKEITKAQRGEAVARIEVYRTWFNKNIMSVDTGHSLLVLPIENMGPRYRDEPPTFDRGGAAGVGSLMLAPVIEAPELVVPVGEVQYRSKVTEREESLPFALGLIGLPGSDVMLIDAALACLDASGRPTVMCTGRSPFNS